MSKTSKKARTNNKGESASATVFGSSSSSSMSSDQPEEDKDYDLVESNPHEAAVIRLTVLESKLKTTKEDMLKALVRNVVGDDEKKNKVWWPS